MSSTPHRPQKLARIGACALALGVCASPSLAHAGVSASGSDPQLQRPQHVARSVNGQNRAVALEAGSDADALAPGPAGPTAQRDPAIERTTEPNDEDSPRRWKHSGLVLDAKAGVLGCLRTICAGSSGHAASPGVRVGGFVGGNIGGVLEVGAQGAWGRMQPGVASGTNVLDLYGVDSAALQQRLDQSLDQATGGLADELGIDALDLDQLAVSDAQLRSIQAGLGLRLHFVPRGRFDAWVGSGIGYELFRADYVTTAGDVRLDFHGLGVPVQGGLSVFVTRRLALGADFEYRWTHFAAGTLQHPNAEGGGEWTLPMSALAREELGGADIAGALPRFWTAGVTARLRV